MNPSVIIYIDPYEMADRLLISIRIEGEAPDLPQRLKGIGQVWWSPTHRLWLMPRRADQVARLLRTLVGYNYVLSSSLEDLRASFTNWNSRDDLLQQYQVLLLSQALRWSVVQLYMSLLREFLQSHPPKAPLGKQAVEEYLAHCWRKWHSRPQRMYPLIETLRLFLELLGIPVREADLRKYQRQYLRDNPISKEDLRRLLATVDNLQHRSILTLTCVAGLKVREVPELLLTQLMLEHKMLLVRIDARGKEQYCNLPDPVIEMLQQYLASWRPKPKKWLFESRCGHPYHAVHLWHMLRYCQGRTNLTAQVYWRNLRRTAYHPW